MTKLTIAINISVIASFVHALHVSKRFLFTVSSSV